MSFLPDVILLGQFPLTVLVLTGAAGGLLAHLLAGWLSSRAATPAEPAQDVIVNAVIGGIAGAKLLYVLVDLPGYLANPAALLVFPFGPLALPAGVVGAAAGVAWGLRRQEGRLSVLDRAAAPLLIGLAVAVAGWHGPGSWAFAPALLVAGGVALWLSLKGGSPGVSAAQSVVLGALALVVADLARPAGNFGLAATVAGTAAWAWLGRQWKKDSAT